VRPLLYFDPANTRRRYSKGLGAVNEIAPAGRLFQRAHELADGIAKLPPLTSHCTSMALTRKLRRVVEDGATFGLALEGISAADVSRAAADA
jgi:hypothetical protein